VQKLWVRIGKATSILLLVVARCDRLEVIAAGNLVHNLWLIVDQADWILNDLSLTKDWCTAWRAGHLS